MDRKLFTIARGGELIKERLHALPMARVVFVFDDDELAARTEPLLPACAAIARYDTREEGMPVSVIGEADAVFVALRDDPRLIFSLSVSCQRIIAAA